MAEKLTFVFAWMLIIENINNDNNNDHDYD